MFEQKYEVSISYMAEIQATLKKQRKIYKALMDKYDPDHENDPVLYAIYNALQNAVKICMNSLYGLNGNQGPPFASQFDIEMRNNAALLAEEIKAEEGAAILGDIEMTMADKDANDSDNSDSDGDDEDNGDDHDYEEGDNAAVFNFKNNKGSEKGCRSGGGYCHYMPVASLITFFGRRVITKSKEFIIDKYPGTIIPYGDTDSLMIHFYVDPNVHKSDLEYRTQLFALGKEAAENCTSYWKSKGRGFLKFELEKILDVFALTKKKKRYFAVYWSAPDKRKKEPKISGLETVKCDKAPALQRIQLEMVNRILERQITTLKDDVKAALLYILNGKNKNYDDFAIIKSLSRDLKDYNGKGEHLAVAKRNLDSGRSGAKKGQEITLGYFRVPDVNLRKVQTNLIARDLNEAKELQLPIFYEYYLEHHFRKPIVSVLEIIDPENAESLYDTWITRKQSLFALASTNSHNGSNSGTNVSSLFGGFDTGKNTKDNRVPTSANLSLKRNATVLG